VTPQDRDRHPRITDRIKDEEIALFTRQFATMVESGLSISRSLGVLLGQMKNKYFAEKISQVRSDVESGRHCRSPWPSSPSSSTRSISP